MQANKPALFPHSRFAKKELNWYSSFQFQTEILMIQRNDYQVLNF